MTSAYNLNKLMKMIKEESDLFDEVMESLEEEFRQIGRSLSGKKVTAEQFEKSNKMFLGNSFVDYLQYRLQETQERLDKLTATRSNLREALKELKKGGSVEVEYIPASQQADS